MARPIRIASFSAYLGDRFEALEQAVTGEPQADVVVGDFMAEITMSMVAAGFAVYPEGLQDFYAESFVQQLRPLLATIRERGVKVVANAGIFNCAGLAEAVRAIVRESGIPLSVAEVRGDDLLPRVAELAAAGELAHLDTGVPLDADPADFVAANAYLGGWGIATALREGADIVVTGRVADASLVTGPAAWWHDWQPTDVDRIAGAVAAAHIIECGPQATGGNFSGFATVANNVETAFPLAEVAENGSCVITKRAGEGGEVTVDTVTAQLLYEIQGPRYLNPDVVLHVDALRLRQDGPDRVSVLGATGSPAPETAKVGLHRYDGFRGVTWIYPTGLQLAEKLDLIRAQVDHAAAGLDLDGVDVAVLGAPKEDPATQYDCTVGVRIAVSGPTSEGVADFGRRFGGLGLGGMPAFYIDFVRTGVGPAAPQARVEYWPGLVSQDLVRHEVVLDDGRVLAVPTPPTAPFEGQPEATPTEEDLDLGPTVDVPLGELVFTRAGDKGGDANLGVWIPESAPGRSEDAHAWLCSFLTPGRVAELLGTDARITAYPMPQLWGISFVLEGYFGASGSSNLGLDQIGKAVGEFLRAKVVPFPEKLLS